MKRLVADTGPLLHLHEAGALHLLPLIGEVHVPEIVLGEARTFVASLPAGALPPWLKVHSLSLESRQRAQTWQQASLLDAGEAAAVGLALELKPDWLLTDDAAARLFAQSMGVEVHGSLGVVLWAAGQRLIPRPEAERLLTGLEQSSLWLSPRLRAQARQALDNLFR